MNARRYLDDYRLVLDPARNLQPLLGVIAFMLLAGFLDLLGVGLVAPFVALVAGQTTLALPRAMEAAASRLSLPTLGGLIVLVFVVKSWLGYHLQRRIVHFSEVHRARLMTRLLEAYLSRSYERHLAVPTSELVNTLFWHTAAYSGGTLASSLRVVTDLVVLVAVIGLLAAISPGATLALGVFLCVIAVSVAQWVRRELMSTSLQVATAQTAALTAVQNSLGAFREIRVLGTATAFRTALDDATASLTSATARQHALHHVPRGTMEASLVAFLVCISLLAWREGGQSGHLVPVLGAMGVAAMRLLPITTSLLSNMNNLRSSRVALRILAEELGSATPLVPLRAASPAHGFRELALRDVSFRYPGAAADSLCGIDFDLKQGEVVGIAGRSGAGKSTLVDVLLGLLTPQSGQIRVDGVATSLDAAWWHAQCAYIPQDVFLLRGSLLENIAFGHAAPDPEQLRRAAQQAGLESVLRDLPRGFDAQVGERGVSLSGGQRQRVAIARALFHDRSLLVMDEATSALDAETESEVVAAIQALRGRRTLIVVAHRESMLAICDRVVRLDQGRVSRAVPTGGSTR